jgi:molybdopterin molybdotransferase
MAISITNALDIIYSQISTLPSETIPIEESLGRTIWSDYIATFDLPRFDNSAMDGYAIRLIDRGERVEGSRVIYAGDDSDFLLSDGEAIRIMTGSATPRGCEAIVPIENAKVDGDRVLLPLEVKPQEHIRYRGEDIKKGDRYISKGDTITAYTIALLASQGVTHIRAVRVINIAVFGTGDELRPHYETIKPHQLYNSNAPMFLARAKELGANVSYIEGSSDTIESLKESIKEALYADLIITSGGVSVGDKDFTKEAFRELGMETLFSGIDIKPGKPTSIGHIDDTIIVNLPGNPLASMVNYEVFIKPIILKLSGTNSCYHLPIETKMREDFRVKSGKYSVILGEFNGSSFSPLSSQAPGMVSPISKADGFIIISPEVSELPKGRSVKMMGIKFNLNSKERLDIFT